jgi:hypothetical protein
MHCVHYLSAPRDVLRFTWTGPWQALLLLFTWTSLLLPHPRRVKQALGPVQCHSTVWRLGPVAHVAWYWVLLCGTSLDGHPPADVPFLPAGVTGHLAVL